MKHLLFLALLTPSVYANDVEIEKTNHATFGGWSYHSTDTEKQPYAYNQVHNGFGYERFWQEKGKDYSMGAGVWYMTDSFRMSAYHIGLTWRYDVSPKIKANLALTYMNRGERVKNTVFTGNGKDLTTYEIKRTNMLVLVPYITLEVYDNLSLDVMWMPSFDDETSVTFARFNYKF